MPGRKSEWGGVHIGDERSQSACKSWFIGTVDDTDRVLKANILERVADGRELKLRVLIEDKDGKQRELVRTRTARGFSIVMQPPTSTPWV